MTKKFIEKICNADGREVVHGEYTYKINGLGIILRVKTKYRDARYIDSYGEINSFWEMLGFFDELAR